ncbi:MAG TPA: response regulator transcription factor [Chitinophagaceae bacterium]|nr:response regulator transcription factor [Chitinophagaceae bacterium]
MKKISVGIVEDHKLVREMWSQLFSGRPEIEIIGKCGEFDEAIEMIKTKRPDIVLLDINLSGASGMDAVPQIRKYSPGTRIIAVSMHSQPAYAKKMIQMGAKGYVTKNSSHEEIFAAVEAVMNGKTYVCMEIKNIISEVALGSESKGPDIKELSLREIEIVKLIKEGLSSKEIAQRINISTRTAEVHRHNILKKLGLKNTASLISFINTTDLSI